MVLYKTDEEIEKIRASCLLVSKTLTEVATLLKPGITGLELDAVAEKVIRDHGAVPGFKGYGGFPATLCISRNECVVHGIPDDKPFEEGEIVSIDCGVYMNDYFGDAAYTFALAPIKDEILHLLVHTKISLQKAIDEAQVGKRLGDIGFAVQSYCEQEHSYGVVRELVGHGIGKKLHESPEVPNYGKRGRGLKLKKGLVIAIEPMINLGKKGVKQAADGWTIVTRDAQPSAHYEHTVAVSNGHADILSDHAPIEDAIKINPALQEISIKN